MKTLIYNEIEPARIPHPDQVELCPLAYVNPSHFSFDPNAWREDSLLRFIPLLCANRPLPKSPSFHKSRGAGPACA